MVSVAQAIDELLRACPRRRAASGSACRCPAWCGPTTGWCGSRPTSAGSTSRSRQMLQQRGRPAAAHRQRRQPRRVRRAPARRGGRASTTSPTSAAASASAAASWSAACRCAAPAGTPARSGTCWSRATASPCRCGARGLLGDPGRREPPARGGRPAARWWAAGGGAGHRRGRGRRRAGGGGPGRGGPLDRRRPARRSSTSSTPRPSCWAACWPRSGWPGSRVVAETMSSGGPMRAAGAGAGRCRPVWARTPR